MSRLAHGALITLAALISCSIGTSPASASGSGAMSINTASTSATSSSPVLTHNRRTGTQLQIPCSSITISSMNITPSGTVSIPARSAQFTSCRIGGLTTNPTQPLAWTGVIRHLDTAPGSGVARSFTLDLAIPAGGISLTAPACAFTVSGTLLGEYIPVGPVPHGTLVNIPEMRIPASLVANSLTLTVANVTGLVCSASGVSNGDLESLAGTFTLAGTGINGAPTAPN